MLALVLYARSDYRIHDNNDAEGVEDTGGQLGGGAPPREEAEEDPEPEPASEPIYVHTGESLWSWDAVGDAVHVGDFYDNGELVEDITDVAIDLDGRFWGVSDDTLYRIYPDSAEVWPVAKLEVYLAGLTFVSDGRLVGAGDGVWEIDTTDGTLSPIVPEGEYETSGDIVGLPDGLLYWTVWGGDGLVTVDPDSGDTRWVGAIGVERIFGLGYADDSLFGFTSEGDAVRIDTETAAAGDSVPLTLSWWGATTNPVLW